VNKETQNKVFTKKDDKEEGKNKVKKKKKNQILETSVNSSNSH
jgi:hypothetical protein